MTRHEWLEIRRLRDEGLGIRAIALRFGCHRRRVRKALNSDRPPQRVGRPRGSIIDEHRGWLLAKLEQYPELSAAKLHNMLTEQNFKGSYSVVKEAVADLRPRLKPVYQTLHFPAGECAQVDWGVWKAIDVAGGRRRLSFFVMNLCYSRMLYAEFFLGETLEFWLAAHRNAFEYFGGVPKCVMVDNCKTAVTKPRRKDSEATLNAYYASFADHYRFTVNPCTPHRPNEKGRVERAVGYIKDAFLAGREPSVPEAINPALWHWLKNTANVRLHRSTGKQPIDLFQDEEKGLLKPLPGAPHPCTVILQAVANSCCRITVGSNRYSIPPQFASTRLVLHRYPDRVIVFAPDGQLVADHPRSFARNTEIVNPEHLEALKHLTSRASENQQITTFLTLGSAAEAYLSGLKEKRADYRKHLRQINTQIAIFGRDQVARALADAQEHNAYAADYILNLLHARLRMNDATDSPLSLVRNADLLNLKISEPNLNAYDKENQ
jgi:transposase